jgi:hypothetical protein
MCVLRVNGKKFDPEKYLASSRLKPYTVFRAGQPQFASQPKSRVHEVSGFKVDVSRRSGGDLAGQVVDAIAFLKKHRQTLARLRSIPEVEDVRLDFPVDLRIDRESVFAVRLLSTGVGFSSWGFGLWAGNIHLSSRPRSACTKSVARPLRTRVAPATVKPTNIGCLTSACSRRRPVRS